MCAMSPRLLRPKASGFGPRSLSGLEAWWDADDASTITTVSGAVSEWRSKVGATRALTQSTAASRPALTANYFGSRPAVTFDGLNDSLSATSLSALAIAPVTVICCIDSILSNTENDRGVLVLSASSVSNSFDIGGGLNIAANSVGRVATRRAFEAYARAAAGGLELETADLQTAQPVGKRILSVTADGSNGLFHQNGSQVDSQAATVTTSTSRIYFGSLVQSNNPSLFWNGRILEVCIYTRALSAAERLRVERYMGNKWGITVA